MKHDAERPPQHFLTTKDSYSRGLFTFRQSDDNTAYNPALWQIRLKQDLCNSDGRKTHPESQGIPDFLTTVKQQYNVKSPRNSGNLRFLFKGSLFHEKTLLRPLSNIRGTTSQWYNIPSKINFTKKKGRVSPQSGQINLQQNKKWNRTKLEPKKVVGSEEQNRKVAVSIICI